MGSLMAGWNKNRVTDETLINRSKSSLTKVEIEEFWRKKQSVVDEHLKDASGQDSATGSGAINIDIPKTIVEEMDMPVSMSPDWWMRSNNAFLNSPPERDVLNKHNKYTAQFEVATKTTEITPQTT